MRLEGWCSPEKAAALKDLIRAIKPALVVEIGVFGGSSLIPIAQAIKENGRGLVYGIDPWTTGAATEGDHAAEDRAWWANVDLASIHAGCMKAITHYELWSQVRIVAARSEWSVNAFADKSIDILHLDGNHSQMASCRDVVLYLPKVRPGGYVFADDTDWPTNQRALAMLDKSCAIVKDIGACRLYQKPE